MKNYSATLHKQEQVKLINQIEQQIAKDNLTIKTVEPVTDFQNDSRICLTSIHFLKQNLLNELQKINQELKKIQPNHYYYPNFSLHTTIKGIKRVSDPPNFTTDEIERAVEVFGRILKDAKKFDIYFFKLILFKDNLTLVGTTDQARSEQVIELDEALRETGINDDNKYISDSVFFANATLVRFTEPVSQEFKNKIKEISENLEINPYQVDSVSLITSNAVLKKLKVFKTWNLN